MVLYFLIFIFLKTKLTVWPLVSNFNAQKSALLQVIRALDVIKLKLYGKYTQQVLTYLSLTVSCLRT